MKLSTYESGSAMFTINQRTHHQKTYRLQKKYSKYIHIGMDGRKNCLVAGIKHTNSETRGMATLTTMGMGAIAREKIMKKAKAGY